MLTFYRFKNLAGYSKDRSRSHNSSVLALEEEGSPSSSLLLLSIRLSTVTVSPRKTIHSKLTTPLIHTRANQY
jgi:hypothetical protein